MFDSPIEHCTVCGHFVVLDQTRSECAHRQQCTGPVCPLQRYFTEVDVGRGIGTVPAAEPAASRVAD